MKTQLRRVIDNLGYLPRTLRLIWDAAPRLTVIWLLLLLVQGTVPIATVWVVRLLVDSLVTAIGAGVSWSSVRPTAVLAATMALLMVAAQLSGLAVNWIRVAQSELIQDSIRALIHDRAYAADLAFFESADYHDHLHRASTDASRRPLALLENGGSLLQSCVTLVGMAALLLQYGVWVPLVLIVSTLPALYVVISFNRRFHRWWERSTPERRWTAYYDWTLTYSEFAAEIRLFALGDHFKDAYQSTRKKLRTERLRILRRESVAKLAAGLAAIVVTGVMLAWMLWRAFAGQVTLGDLVLFYQAFERGQALMRSLLGNLGQVYSNTLFLENLFEFLDLGPEVSDPPDPVPAPATMAPAIRFRDVTFKYPGSEQPALEDFNLDIPAGRVVALVGPNGAGKSTLIKLLCRYYDPLAGSVEVGGVDVRKLRVSDLRRMITVLFQTPVQYHATLGRNIAFGDLTHEPTNDAIETAAAGAGADTIARKLPNGYDTLLGKWFAHGTQLSNGEWQRVALARAFLRDAGIVVLDEPTSAMDSWAESEWLDRFRMLARDRTAVVVTHRFTVALKADVVHVMEAGKIVESGPPEELVAANGPFSASWKAQRLGAVRTSV